MRNDLVCDECSNNAEPLVLLYSPKGLTKIGMRHTPQISLWPLQQLRNSLAGMLAIMILQWKIVGFPLWNHWIVGRSGFDLPPDRLFVEGSLRSRGGVGKWRPPLNLHNQTVFCQGQAHGANFSGWTKSGSLAGMLKTVWKSNSLLMHSYINYTCLQHYCIIKSSTRIYMTKCCCWVFQQYHPHLAGSLQRYVTSSQMVWLYCRKKLIGKKVGNTLGRTRLVRQDTLAATVLVRYS